VKFEVSEDGGVLMGTDLEVGIRCRVSGIEVETPGTVILPVGRFGSILRESSDQTMLLESTDRKTRVVGQRSEFQLPTENPEEFPNVGSFTEEQYHELSGRLLRELVHRTVFATDNESSRYALGGVLVELAEEGITAVATDGRRLACQVGPAKPIGGIPSGEGTTIVPSRAMQLIERTLTDEETIKLAFRENEIVLQSEQATLFAQLVEGRYPKWRDVFPRSENVHKIEITVGPFHAAVRQAGIMTDKDHRGIDLHFREGTLGLAGRGAELGESHIELPIAYEGPDTTITLDPRYFSDFLRVLEPEKTFTLELKDGETAVVCRTDDGYAYIVMPLVQDSPGR